MKVVALSDTHGQHRAIEVPEGDVLIHCGDWCRRGDDREVNDFADWLKTLPHRHKLITAGNHDKPVANEPEWARSVFAAVGATLLLNQEVVIKGVKFWASPVTPTFMNWHFMKNRGAQIERIWSQIPWDVDVLITHGPPYGHGDLAPGYRTPYPKVVGCLDLLNRIREIAQASNNVHPSVHCFGHIHAGHGITNSGQFPGVQFINASICTEQYRPTNTPQVFTVKAREDR